MNQALVIIPTYNERENIQRIGRKVMGLDPGFDLLVVDDSSPDGTANLVRELAKEFPGRVHLLERSGKQGLGTAYIAGFKEGLQLGYEYLIEMDADFSHDPDDLPRLLEACQNGADLAIGSRYCKGGKVSNWTLDRKLLSYFASIYVRMILRIGVKDTTAGFKCYRRKVLETIDLSKVTFRGYAFQICLKYLARKAGFNLVEVPIVFKDRELGESKMSISIFKEAFWGVWRMRKL